MVDRDLTQIKDSTKIDAPVSSAPQTSHPRRSSLSARLAMLVASLLIVSAVATAIFAAMSVRSTERSNVRQSMANVHAATRELIDLARADVARYRADTLASRKAQLKDQVQTAVGAIDELRAATDRGEMSEAVAQSTAKELILNYRFGTAKSYFFAFTPDMVSVAEPNPTFIGDMIDYRDPAGKYFFHDFRDIAKGPGDGYVDYVGTRPGASAPAPKISYITLYKPWQWVIGTGAYIDDIDQEASLRIKATKKSLDKSLSGVTFNSTGFVFVLDRKGRVVAAPRDHKLTELGTTAAGRALAAKAIANSPRIEGQISHFVAKAVFQKGRKEQWGFDISTDHARRWVLVSAVPNAELTRAGDRLAFRQSILSLIVLILGLAIGLLASRRIARPVQQLTRAAAALERDHFDPSMLNEAAGRKDELGSLARAFRNMATQIVKRERSLREQVRRLTVAVDHDKVAKSVEEMGDDDFFRDLQERGRKLREGP